MGLYNRLGLKAKSRANFTLLPYYLFFHSLPPSFLLLYAFIWQITMSNQLNRKQLVLSFHTSGRLKANRPRPKVKPPTTLTAAASAALIFGVRRRRKVSGVNEREVI
jgi:hypothetical protein